MAALADFERYVLPFIQDAPIVAVHDAIRDACIEFCERSRIISQILEDKFTVSANVPEIDVDSPDSDLAISQPINVWTSEGLLTPTTRPELSDLYPKGWVNQSTADVARVAYWLATARNVVRLVPYLTVTKASEVTIEVALKPLRESTAVPDLLFEDYAEDIGAGALGRLHEHPAAPYAIPDRVAGYRKNFDRAIMRAADLHARGFGKPRLRVQQDELR